MSKGLKESLRRAMMARKTTASEELFAPTEEERRVEDELPTFSSLDDLVGVSALDEDSVETDLDLVDVAPDLAPVASSPQMGETGVVAPRGAFVPAQPRSFSEAGLDEGAVEALLAKTLLQMPGATGAELGRMTALRPKAVAVLLAEMKNRKLVVHRSGTATGDFSYVLTEAGVLYAEDARRQSRYVGPAPVAYDDYLESVRLQSISREQPRRAHLMEAFDDLIVPDHLLDQLGPAVISGKGMFMFGNPGNGKTSIAERITRAFGSAVWLPYAIHVHGEIIRIFDPVVHRKHRVQPERTPTGERIDHRWVLCERPTVVVGGELTMDSLELAWNESSGTSEAPIQLKANCGTLVIDDFGRQRMDPATLLNRWIVPLEQRVDFLSLRDGRKVRFPFDPLLIFSTNLDPQDLVDEAFLRRIPYKIEVDDPDEPTFRRLFALQANALGFPNVAPAIVDYVIMNHFRLPGRSFRNCHPRDLLLQVKNQCLYKEEPLTVTPEALDRAAKLYFAIFGEGGRKKAVTPAGARG